MTLSDAIRLGLMLHPQGRCGIEFVRVRGYRGWLFGQCEATGGIAVSPETQR